MTASSPAMTATFSVLLKTAVIAGTAWGHHRALKHADSSTINTWLGRAIGAAAPLQKAFGWALTTLEFLLSARSGHWKTSPWMLLGCLMAVAGGSLRPVYYAALGKHIILELKSQQLEAGGHLSFLATRSQAWIRDPRNCAPLVALSGVMLVTFGPRSAINQLLHVGSISELLATLPIQWSQLVATKATMGWVQFTQQKYWNLVPYFV